MTSSPRSETAGPGSRPRQPAGEQADADLFAPPRPLGPPPDRDAASTAGAGLASPPAGVPVTAAASAAWTTPPRRPPAEDPHPDRPTTRLTGRRDPSPATGEDEPSTAPIDPGPDRAEAADEGEPSDPAAARSLVSRRPRPKRRS